MKFNIILGFYYGFGQKFSAGKFGIIAHLSFFSHCHLWRL